MYGARQDNGICGLFGGATFAIRRGSETPFVHRRGKTPNASAQAIELNPKCSEQGHSMGPRTGPGIENMDYRCAFRIPSVPYMIRPLSRADAQFR